jgi:hypothetical protein
MRVNVYSQVMPVDEAMIEALDALLVYARCAPDAAAATDG